MARGRVNYFVIFIVMMCAFAVILSFVPFLGYIHIGGPFFTTTLFLPVAAAAVMLGPGAGAFVGLFTGLCRFAALSFISSNLKIAQFFTPFTASLHAPASLWSLATGLVSPVLAGIITGLVARRLDKLLRSRALCFGAAGLLGGFVNWSLTHLFIILIYSNVFSSSFNTSFLQVALKSLRIDAPVESIAAALICAVPAAVLHNKYIAHD